MPGDELNRHEIMDGNDKENAASEHPSPTTKSPNPNDAATISLPVTPATRLPLADLIANTEDVSVRPPHNDITPVDRILWQPERAGSTPSSVRTPAPRRRKRARSSSPASSQNDPLSHFPANESFDMQHLSKQLKTPQNDPAAELWSRYAEGNRDGKSNGPGQNAVFSHIISSPQTPGRRRDATGLQRSSSLGTDWPVSKAKRRRIDTQQSVKKTKDVFAQARSDLLQPGRPKASKVSLLVEKIQESMKYAPRPDPDAPSSSSPLPERSLAGERSSLSPSCKRGVEAGLMGVDETLDGVATSATYNASDKPVESDLIQADEESSDYGDAEFDMDLVNAVEQREARDGDNLIGLETKNLENSQKPVDAGVTPAVQPGLSNSVAAMSNMCAPKNSFDEFDDGDEEFAAGLEELAAKFDDHQQVTGQVINMDNQIDRGVAWEETQQRKQEVQEDTITQGQSLNGNGDSDDEYGDDVDLQSLAVIENVIQTQGRATHSHHSTDTRTIKRYLITNVADGQYLNAQGHVRPEKILLVQDEAFKVNKAVVLRQSWYESPCTTSSYIHVIGDFDACGRCVVDDEHNMIILHPDHLISATAVADSFSCLRRAVLQDRVKSTSEATRPLVFGSILHEIFQEAMKSNRWDLEWLKLTTEDVVIRHLDSLYQLQMSVYEAMDHLMSKMPEVKAWAEIFVTATPKPNATVRDRDGHIATMTINKLLEVEEHIWSPMYGLKGNIDATVQVAMQDGHETKTLTVPFELKTGRNATENHRAQTALYTLLLSDRYDVEVMYGILYYLENSETFRVQGIRNEIREMIIQRNELACYVRNRLKLPPVIKKPHLCGKCYAKTECFIYHRLVENGDGETSGMADKFNDDVNHLQPSHQTFFQKWDDLLTKEEKDMLKFKRELWTMLSTEREALGRCFANLVIESGSAYESEGGQQINKFRYTFVKQRPASGFSFEESYLTVGEPIVISDENGHFALATGYVTHVRPRRITVAVDRKLHNVRTKRKDFDAAKNQSYTGIMEIAVEGSRVSTKMPQESEEPLLYRLDKDEFSSGMATARNNLIRMMEKGLYRARELRDLIIDGRSPHFREASTPYTLSGPASQANVNSDQHRAIKKVLNAKEYALVLGMPGTGKTTTIAHIIRALVSQGKSVLLTSYTHTAVDNILLKIRDDNISILRLGTVAKVHPEIQQFADLAGVPKKSLDDLKRSYEQSKVVATTCLGVNHPIFSQRLFDYCIVDEASQVTLPVCLGPIRMAKTFILVGDHYQLPPLVQNKQAAEGGLDISLFKFLSDTQPDSVVSLEHQYRMCSDIMLLSNTLIYSGRLKCGTEAVETRTLRIPNIAALGAHHPAAPSSLLAPSSSRRPICASSTLPTCWLSTLLNPTSKVLFANTDSLLPSSLETAQGARIINTLEADLLSQYVEGLLTVGVSPRDIGVITFYRSQLSLLKQLLGHRLPDLEMHTADRFQGRDKEVVIVSCVRSNEANNAGELLKDWRRVNVACTRARSKLVIFGSLETLRESGVEVLKGLVDIVRQKRWVVDLPPGAKEMHLFDDTVSQGMTTASARSQALGADHPSSSPSSSEKKNRSPLKPKMGAGNIRSPLKGMMSPPRLSGRSPGKENRAGKAATTTTLRKPEKVGKGMNVERLLGSGKRPVLEDVFNDLLG